MALRITLIGDDAERFASLMSKLSDAYSSSSPEQSVRWLMDNYAGTLERFGNGNFAEDVCALWNELVAPYSCYPTPVITKSLRRSIGECMEDIPSIDDWHAILAKLVTLRGAIESGSFGLSKLVSARKGERLINLVAAGQYDKWTEPKETKDITLEDILSGRDTPDNWLTIPPSKYEETINHVDAPEAFCFMLCSNAPWVARYIIDFHGSDLTLRAKMRCLTDPLLQRPDVDYWGSFGHNKGGKD